MALDQKMNSRADLFGTVFSANVLQKLQRLDPSRLPIILVIVLVSIPGFKIGSGSCAFIPWSSICANMPCPVRMLSGGHGTIRRLQCLLSPT